MNRVSSNLFTALALGCTLFLHGCLILPVLPMVISGIGSAAGYSILNTAYKTEIYPEKDVLRNSIKALDKMGFVITEAKRSSAQWVIAAETPERKVTIELERITPKTTKITVNVMEGSVIKDKATAEAIISEVESLLKEEEDSKRKTRNALLFIATKPKGATVKIMNIVPRFQQGIELSPGSYQLEISMEKYTTRRMKIKLKSYEERFIEVLMKKER